MKDDLEFCETLLRQSGSSFRLAIRWLAPGPREAMTALYAFARQVDDLVDEEPDRVRARQGIVRWRNIVARLPDDPAPDPIARALAFAMRERGLPREALDLLLDGMEQDLEGPVIESFADLCAYCHRVAGSIGLATMAVLGLGEPWARRHAVLAGCFVQVVNVIRDVGVDAMRGRVYLPRQDLAIAGLSPTDLLDPGQEPALRRVLQWTARRAREIDRMAEAAIPRQQRSAAAFPRTLRSLYREVLDGLEQEGFPVTGEPVRLRTATLVRVGLREGMGLVLGRAMTRGA